MNDIAAAIADAGIALELYSDGQSASIPKEKGAYLLLLRLDKVVPLDLPECSTSALYPGWFVYAGSANGPGGMRSRLKRHFSKAKTCHWHVDRLSLASVEDAAVPVVGGNECDLMDALLRSDAFDVAVKGFGNTDCRRCRSHLAIFRR